MVELKAEMTASENYLSNISINNEHLPPIT